MKRVLLATTAAAAVAVAGLLPAAAAPTAFGSLYEVSSAIANSATVANVPTGPADVTFTAPSSPLSFNPTNSSSIYMIGSWLGSGGATILTGGGHAGNSMDNTLINFTGTVSVTTGEKFSAGHDDGVTLVIGGTTVINSPPRHVVHHQQFHLYRPERQPAVPVGVRGVLRAAGGVGCQSALRIPRAGASLAGRVRGRAARLGLPTA